MVWLRGEQPCYTYEYAVIKIVDKDDGAKAEAEAVQEKQGPSAPPSSPGVGDDEELLTKHPEKKPSEKEKGKEAAKDGAPPAKKRQKA